MKNLSKGLKSSSLKSSGFSLVETLVAMGILGIISLSSGRLIENQLRSQRRIEIANSRDSIAKLVQANLANSAAISNSKSKTENSHYVKCKTGLIIDAVTGALDPAGCVALISAAAKEHDFTLYTPLGATPISGSLSAPLYYDARGNVCPGAADNCPLEVKTWFVTACPAGATSCAKGTNIEYRYSVSSIDPRISIRPITGIWTESDVTGVTAQSAPTAAVAPSANTISCYGAIGTTSFMNVCCVYVGARVSCYDPSTGLPWGTTIDVSAGKVWAVTDTSMINTFTDTTCYAYGGAAANAPCTQALGTKCSTTHNLYVIPCPSGYAGSSGFGYCYQHQELTCSSI